MSTILVEDMTLERLRAVFIASNVPARIVEYFPATADSPRDAVLSVEYPDNRDVLIWPENQQGGSNLRLRAIVFNRHQRDEMPQDVLQEVEAELNQNAECFGALSAFGLHGVTIDYLIPFEGGVLEEAVRLAAERIAIGISLAREEISAALQDQ